jgi:8-oxo-dGTP pyrophosphatase MutT (NUDIX family)
MISLEVPAGFKPKFEIASIFCECDGRFILLHRNGNKPQGNTWGVPAGKIEGSENAKGALLRELMQETGIVLDERDVNYFKKVFVRCNEYDFIYYMFHVALSEKPDVAINKSEHSEFKWVTPKEALNMPLIHDLGNCIKLFYG